MAKTIITLNTKGGPGKTTISTQVLPVLFASTDSEIKIFELDNNNNTNLKNSSLSFETMRADDSEDTIFSVAFHAEKDNNNIVNIIDAGGGDDTLKVLAAVEEADIKNAIYVIPVNDDIEQIDNAVQTIEEIRNFDEDAEIVMILNRAIIEVKEITALSKLLESDTSSKKTEREIKEKTENLKKTIEDQFIGLYGSKDYNLPDRTKDEIFTGVKISYVPNSKIFGITKNIYQTTLADIYPINKELLDNLGEHKKAWSDADDEDAWIENMKRVRIAKEIVSLVESFTPLKNLMGV